jgi:hypothetical protein
MKNLLSPVDSCLPPGAIFQLEFDEWVPLQFKTYSKPLGSGFLRLGNYRTQLVEICVEPHFQVVRGLTLTSFDGLSPWPSFSETNSSEGLPILATDFEGWKVVDLDQDFRVALRDNRLMIFWDTLGACESYIFGRARFLARGGDLVGVSFGDLAADELDHFRSHLAEG